MKYRIESVVNFETTFYSAYSEKALEEKVTEIIKKATTAAVPFQIKIFSCTNNQPAKLIKELNSAGLF